MPIEEFARDGSNVPPQLHDLLQRAAPIAERHAKRFLADFLAAAEECGVESGQARISAGEILCSVGVGMIGNALGVDQRAATRVATQAQTQMGRLARVRDQSPLTNHHSPKPKD